MHAGDAGDFGNRTEKEKGMIRVISADSTAFTAELCRNLSTAEYHVVRVQTGSGVLAHLEREEMDIVILCTRLPDMDGVKALREIKTRYPLVEVIMLVGRSSVGDAVRSMKHGAYHCLTTPVRPSELIAVVNRAYDEKWHGNKSSPGDRSGVESHSDALVGESGQIRAVKEMISLVGPCNAPVLILGETGTGKELIARAIHKASHRRKGPFVPVNASALPEGMLESELFGHKKGAFTSAQSDKAGLLEIADKGTFFGDEIGDMCAMMQAKLLRLIETGTFRKLGDTREIRVNVRLVSATNKDLENEVTRKTFRADLFFRLSTFIIPVPPLRERREDIPLLANYFLHKMSRGGAPKRVSPEALSLLTDYSWPGNIRELKNVLQRAVVLSRDSSEIGMDKLLIDAHKNEFNHSLGAKRGGNGRGGIMLDEVTQEHIKKILAATDGNKSQAARLLGISRTKLYNRLGNG